VFADSPEQQRVLLAEALQFGVQFPSTHRLIHIPITGDRPRYTTPQGLTGLKDNDAVTNCCRPLHLSGS
jgi:hypothetical protein